MRRSQFAVIILAIAVVAALSVFVVRYMSASSAQAVPAPEPPRGVAALGYIEPEDGSVRLSARSLSGQASIVKELRVKEGDQIRTGDVVAVLDSSSQLAATLRQAEARVGSARARLAQARAGTAKAGEVAAQQTEISRMEIELLNARSELRRMQQLHDDAIGTDAALDAARLLVDTRLQLVNSAKERLRALEEVRPVDLDVFDAQVKEAEADVVRARAEYEAATIRSPIDGRVLKVHAWPGADVGPNGVVEIANTQKMYVVAEVAQSDIDRVALGQRARITGAGIAGALEGAVTRIGRDVARNSSTFDNPRTLTTTRIVEVRIALDDSTAAERLIHAQVEVRLNVR